MTDILRGQGGDGSPQLDLDAIARQARIQQNIRAHLRDCDAEIDALRGRVEELTEALRDGVEVLAYLPPFTEDRTSWLRRATALLARVVPEKETP